MCLATARSASFRSVTSKGRGARRLDDHRDDAPGRAFRFRAAQNHAAGRARSTDPPGGAHRGHGSFRRAIGNAPGTVRADRMKKIILHIGQGKTGTSAIQSFLALNTVGLKSSGIAYPHHKSFDRARRGGISSGNFRRTQEYDEKIIKRIRKYSESKILFSSEFLLNLISGDPDRLENLKKSFEVELILFVRDPIEGLVSSYGQSVKRGGNYKEISDFVENYRTPEEVLRFLNLANSRQWKVEIINFTRCRADLIGVFLDRLGVGREGWVSSKNSVNRSLSMEEICIARAFNKEFGEASARFIADPFCEEIPDYRGTVLGIPEEAAARFVEKNEEYLSRIDALLPEGERFSPTWRSDRVPADSQAADHLVITKRHFDVLAAAIGAHFGRTVAHRDRARPRAEPSIPEHGGGSGDPHHRDDDAVLQRLREENAELRKKVSRLRGRVRKSKGRRARRRSE